MGDSWRFTEQIPDQDQPESKGTQRFPEEHRENDKVSRRNFLRTAAFFLLRALSDSVARLFQAIQLLVSWAKILLIRR